MSTPIPKLLERRTRQVVVVLEDLYQPHNASSIIKSCDAFGIQDLYVINRRNRFQFDPAKTQGVEGWIHINEFSGDHATTTCLQQLKQAGYRIAATSLRPGCISIDELPLSGKLALCFGTEEKGLSEEAHRLADVFLRIPMYGLTQSFNVSVTVALSLQKLLSKAGPAGFHPLESAESAALQARWQAHNLPSKG